MKSNEEHKRSIAKAITYRVYQSFIISPFIIYFLTKDIKLSVGFGIVEFFVKIPTYYIFERIWSFIKKGYK